jgi:RNA polymerase sigma factor (sigma-70 family)
MTSEQVLPRQLARWIAAEPEWEHVYAEQCPRVLNFFRYRVGDTADVEELTARTFETAWRARHGSRQDVGRLTTWLLTIARNIAIDHLHSRPRRQPIDSAVAAPSTDHRLERQVLQHSGQQRFMRLLATLPPRQRELIAMKYGADMTNRAIARATGLSETNVATILHRAVETLRTHCGEELPCNDG